MTAEEIQEIARKATTGVWRRWKCPPWTTDDWDDLVQSACLGICELLADPRYANPSRGLLFTTACNAVRAARRWQVFGSNPHDTLPLIYAKTVLVDVEPEEEAAPLAPALAETVHALLLAERTPKARKAERTQIAARRDVEVLALLMDGYHSEGVAVEMGMSEAWVDQRRLRLKDALAHEAARRGVSPGDIAEMRRNPCNFDDFRYTEAR